MGWLSKKSAVPETLHNLLVQSFGQVRKDVQNVYDWLKFLYNQNTFQQHLLEEQRKQIGDLRAQIALMPQNKEEVRALIDAYYDIEPVLKHVEQMESRLAETIKNRPPEVSVPEVAEQVTNKLSYQVFDQVEQAKEKLAAQISHMRDDLKEELKSQISNELEAHKPEPIVEESAKSEAMDALNEKLAAIQEQLSKLQEKPVSAPAPQIQPVQPVIQQPVYQQPVRQQSALKEKLMRSLTRNSKEYIKNTILGLIKKYQKITGLQLREILVEEQGLVSRSSFYRLLNELENERSELSVIQHGKEKIYILSQPTAEQHIQQ